MSYQLFTDLSIEQQETVAGGAPAQAVNITGFTSAFNFLGSASFSGPNGSATQSTGVSDKRLTLGLSGITLDTTSLPGFPSVGLPIL